MHVKLGYSSAIVGALGSTITVQNWGTALDGTPAPGFYLGLTFIGLSGVAAVGACIARVTMSLDDAFQHGYRVGYRKGQRKSTTLHLVRDDSA